MRRWRGWRAWLPWLASAGVTVGLALALTPGLADLRRVDERESETRGERPPARSAPQPREADRLEPLGIDLDLLPIEPARSEPAGAISIAATPPVVLQPVDPATTEVVESWADEAAADDAASMLECLIEPYEIVDIGSPVVGLIETVYVERGDQVEEGQVLAELESGVERAAVALAEARARLEGAVQVQEARLSLGERKQDRARKLFEQEAVSLELRDELDTEAEVARLELKRAREDRLLASLQLEQAREVLRRRRIRSPLKGLVVERRMAAGERVDEETILRIAQLDPLRVEVILPAALHGTVRPGMRAAVTPELPTDDLHVAEVTIVDPVIDAASGTFGVRLELPNPDHTIPSGLHCQVRFLRD